MIRRAIFFPFINVYLLLVLLLFSDEIFPPIFFFICIQRKKMFTVFLASLATCYFVAPLVTSCFKKHSAKFEQYDDGRQKYIVKSVMKSVILALLCPYGMWIATVGSWNNDALSLDKRSFLNVIIISFLKVVALVHIFQFALPV